MRKLNYGQIDAENPGTTQGKKVPGALETLTGLENLQVTDTGGGIWRSVSHISWSKNSVLSLATAHSVSVYLFFQQRCAQSPCSGSQRSQKPQQGTTALGELGLRSGGGATCREHKGRSMCQVKGSEWEGAWRASTTSILCLKGGNGGQEDEGHSWPHGQRARMGLSSWAPDSQACTLHTLLFMAPHHADWAGGLLTLF